MEQIKDGTGKSYLAKVGQDNLLWVKSKSSSLQHIISENDQDAYQVWGTASLTSGITNILHVVNNSSSKNMVITFIRLQIISEAGGTAIPNDSNYFTLGTGRTYATSGEEAIPINMFLGDGKISETTVYQENPNLNGTSAEFDRWYPKASGEMYIYNKLGALIVPTERSLEISFVGDHTSGTAFSRISYIMEGADE